MWRGVHAGNAPRGPHGRVSGLAGVSFQGGTANSFTEAPPPKRPRQQASMLIPEMFVDPWIQEYARVDDVALRRVVTQHLSSASRESVEMRAGKLAREKEIELRAKAAEEEVEIFF